LSNVDGKRDTKPAETTRNAGSAVFAMDRRHARVAVSALLFSFFMLGMSYAAVPLYDMFCRVTGFGGTTQVAERAPDRVLDRTVTVRFDGNVASGLGGWEFEPVQRTMTVRIGESNLAFYRATNTTDRPLVGTASFNVAPDAAGAYFAKIACFCFTEQRLEPGQSVEMPVSFFVDPEFVDDKDSKRLSQITLSYTFFPVDTGNEGVARADAEGDQPRG